MSLFVALIAILSRYIKRRGQQHFCVGIRTESSDLEVDLSRSTNSLFTISGFNIWSSWPSDRDVLTVSSQRRNVGRAPFHFRENTRKQQIWSYRSFEMPVVSSAAPEGKLPYSIYHRSDSVSVTSCQPVNHVYCAKVKISPAAKSTGQAIGTHKGNSEKASSSELMLECSVKCMNR